MDKQLPVDFIYIFGEINNDLAKAVLEKILILKSKKKTSINLKLENTQDPLNIYINSGGGELSAAVSIVNTFKMYGGPIHTFVMGDCESAATLISLAGDWRYAYKSSIFMHHQAHLDIEDNYSKDDAEAMMNTLKMEEDRWLDLCMYHANRSRVKSGTGRARCKKIKRELFDSLNKKSSTYLLAEKVYELGLIDEILE